MKYWQYNVRLIPDKKVKELFEVAPFSLKLDQFEDILWWQNCQPEFSLYTYLDGWLSRIPQWSENVIYWGTKDINTVSIIKKDEQIIDMEICYNCRELDKGFQVKSLELAQKLHALLYTRDTHIIHPLYSSLNNVLEKFSDDLRIDPQGILLRRAATIQREDS